MNVKDQVVEFLVKYGFQILGGIIIFACGLFIANAAGRLVKKSLTRFRLEPPVELLLVRVVKLIILLLTAVLTVAKMGVDIAPLVAGMGVIGVGIGLATQGVLSNLVAGLLIIFTKPFRVGEYVELLGESGVVQMIDLFSTKLAHADKSVVVIPNRKIVGEILHNYGMIRQLDLTVAVTYDSDIPTVESAIRQVLAANPKVLKEPSPVVAVAKLDDFGLNFAVKPWVAVPDFVPSHGEIYQAILTAFREKRIAMPLIQRQIRILHNDAPLESPGRVEPARSATGL